MELFYYLIRSASILGLFYLVYWFALRRHTWFIANRQYLIFGILAALFLPLVEFTQTVYLPAPQTEPALELIGTALPIETLDTTTSAAPFDWVLLAVGLYILGCLVGLIRFGYQSWSLLRVLKKGNYSKKNGFYYIETTQRLEPFSFFKYLVYNPNLHACEELAMILEHERAHAKGWHSLDVLLSNALTIIHWLNPVAWWYKKSIIQNLEYIADQQTVREIPSKTAYQLALVKASTGAQHLALSNSFYQSFIKNRIVMLNANQSRKIKKWRLLLILPLLVVFMYSFNVNTEFAYLDKEPAVSSVTAVPSFLVDKNSTAADLETIETFFAENHPEVSIEFSNEKWIDQQLTAYQMEVLFPGSGTSGGKLIDERTDEAVIPRVISFKQGPAVVIEHLEDREDYMVIDLNGITYFNPEIDLETQELKSAVPSATNKTGQKPVQVTAQTKNNQTTTISTPDFLYIINEKPWTMDDLPAGKKIVTSGHIESLSPEEGLAQYGKTGKDGVMVVHGKARFEDDAPTSQTTFTGYTNDVKVKISASMSKAELDEKIAYLRQNHDIELVIEDIQYNADNQIRSIKLRYSREGSSGHYAINNDNKAIDDIILVFGADGSIKSYSGGQVANARSVARRAASEARKQATDARRLARADQLEARKAEMAAKRDEMRLLQEAKKAEMAAMTDAQKAEMKADIAALRAKERAIAAEQRALASSRRSNARARGYARSGNRGRTATVTGSVVSDVYITKYTTDADLAQIKKELAAEGVSFSYKRVKRNAAGEITGIKITLDNNEGSRSSTQVSGKEDGIDDIHLEY
ncbi:M56 family metallopeptidase [Gilvibacter sp.]|uniref:M56 family metallopeptidase n=1 Tax=Gilvibacter sp. TaxID=2729997 RepID=UPI003B517861